MTKKLLNFAKDFIKSKSDPAIFSQEFISQWKKERDSGAALSDEPDMSEALSSIFCFVDMFSPDEDRESYEFDEPKLRNEIEKLLDKKGFL